jgi:hypothetical protein
MRIAGRGLRIPEFGQWYARCARSGRMPTENSYTQLQTADNRFVIPMVLSTMYLQAAAIFGPSSSHTATKHGRPGRRRDRAVLGTAPQARNLPSWDEPTNERLGMRVTAVSPCHGHKIEIFRGVPYTDLQLRAFVLRKVGSYPCPRNGWMTQRLCSARRPESGKASRTVRPIFAVLQFSDRYP